MLIFDEPDDEAICREGLYVVLFELAMTIGDYDCLAVHPNYIWPRNEQGRRSSVRSDGDHRRQPGLRPAELNTNFTEVLPGLTTTIGKLRLLGSPPGLRLVDVGTNFRNEPRFHSS
jgi:hypothetical protein